MPAGKELHNGALDTREPFLRGPDRLDIFLQNDLVRRVLEWLQLEPSAIPCAPVLLSRKDPAVAQQEGTGLLLVRADRFDCDCPGANQIAERLMGWIRNPHGRQLTGSQQAGEHRRVTPI